MKRFKFNKSIPCVILLAMMLNQALASATEEDRIKEIRKSYKVTSDTEISISNSFGKVHIDTWNKNELDVNIRIVVRGRTAERAEELLDRINVSINDSNPQSEISFHTSIPSKMNTRENESFEINYDVSMPRNNAIEVRNSFGDTYIGDLDGEINLDVSYGNLTAGFFSGEADVKISFGNGVSEMAGMNNGDLKISYSKLEVGRLGTVDLDAQFSTVSVEIANTVDLIAKYGKVEIDEIQIIEADVDFSGFEVGKLGKSLDLDVDYGNEVLIGGVSADTEFLKIQNSFGPVSLEMEDDLNGTLEAEMSYCDLKYPEGMIDFKKIIKDNTSKEYEGIIGNGSNTRIEIVSKYGNVKIRRIKN